VGIGGARHSLFADTGIELELTRDRVHFPAFGSADDEVEFYSTTLGPAITARRIAEANGTWHALRDDMASLHDPNGEVAEYLQIVGAKR
jgi:hypothetical protein